MARRTTGEYKIITLDFNKLLKDSNASVDAPGWYLGEIGAKIGNVINTLERGLKGTVGEGGFLVNRDRYITDPNTGAGKLPIVIKQEYEKQTRAFLNYFSGRQFGEASNAFLGGLSVEDAVKVEMTKSNVAGRKAMNALIAEASKAGGYAEVLAPTKSKAERVKATLFTTASDMRTDAELWNETFPETISFSKQERKARKIKESERNEKELAKIAEQEMKRQRADNEKRERSEEKLRQNDEKRKAKEEKEKTARNSRLISATLRILASLGIIADIARRILTASIKNASEQTRIAVQASELGVGYGEARQAGFFETSRGLPKGIYLGAMTALQGRFGDVTTLDEKALGVLARVMGADIEKAVRTGMYGGENVKFLMQDILDSFFKQWREGKNSLGQFVGQTEAKRELVTVLKQVSPELATLFSKWTSDYSGGIYAGRGDTWSEYYKLQKFGSLLPSEQSALYETGQTIDKINGMIENFKSNVMQRLTLQFEGFIKDISNKTWGLNASEKQEVFATARDINLKSLKQERLYSEVAEKQLTEIAEKYGYESISFTDGILSMNKKGEKGYKGIRDLERTLVEKGDIQAVFTLADYVIANEQIPLLTAEANKGLGEKVQNMSLSSGSRAHAVQQQAQDIINRNIQNEGTEREYFAEAYLEQYRELMLALPEGKDFKGFAKAFRKSNKNYRKLSDADILAMLKDTNNADITNAIRSYYTTGDGKKVALELQKAWWTEQLANEDTQHMIRQTAMEHLSSAGISAINTGGTVTKFDIKQLKNAGGHLTGEADVTVHIALPDGTEHKESVKVDMSGATAF